MNSKSFRLLSTDRARPLESGRSIRPPISADGVQIHDLIRACPPLDINSLYCNLLQCAHFAETCAVAEERGRVVGWISGYRPPLDRSALFVWQVAVAPDVRGSGLAIGMLEHILARTANRDVVRVEASVTSSNLASIRMFQRFARRRAAVLEWFPWLDRVDDFQDRHDSEWLLRIGPIEARIEPRPLPSPPREECA